MPRGVTLVRSATGEAAPRSGAGRPGRLTVAEVRRLERLVGDDVELQAAVLCFIGHYYSADSLLEIPRAVYGEMMRRPGDFLSACQRFYAPELKL